MDDHKLYTKRDAAVLTGLSGSTLHRYAREDKIKSKRTPGGHFLYDISTLVKSNTEVKNTKQEEVVQICYCRVSTHGQRDDLQRQIKYMSEKYPTFEIISDVGSGINFKRPGLKKIIQYAIDGKLQKLVVAYKDRLCRIGYDLIEYILTTYSNTEIIVDHKSEETLEQEISNDILQIINVYSAKINGMRSYTPKNDTK